MAEYHSLPAKIGSSEAIAVYIFDDEYPYTIVHVCHYQLNLIEALEFELITFHPYRVVLPYCSDMPNTDLLETRIFIFQNCGSRIVAMAITSALFLRRNLIIRCGARLCHGEVVENGKMYMIRSEGEYALVGDGDINFTGWHGLTDGGGYACDYNTR